MTLGHIDRDAMVEGQGEQMRLDLTNHFGQDFEQGEQMRLDLGT